MDRRGGCHTWSSRSQYRQADPYCNMADGQAHEEARNDNVPQRDSIHPVTPSKRRRIG